MNFGDILLGATIMKSLLNGTHSKDSHTWKAMSCYPKGGLPNLLPIKQAALPTDKSGVCQGNTVSRRLALFQFRTLTLIFGF